MNTISKNIVIFIISFISFLLIDYLFLHFIVSDFYKQSLARHLNMVNNKVFIRLVPAALVYVVLTLGLMFFVYNEQLSLLSNLMRGAAFGFVSYAVYDLTNMATLANWPVVFALVDMAWGTTVSAIVTLITIFISQQLL